MGFTAKRIAAIALVLPAIAAGCGGGASGQPSAAGAASASPEDPARQFIIPGGENYQPEFGREAPTAERQAVSRLVHSWMRARVARAWTKDCSYLSRHFKKAIVVDAESVTSGKATTCAKALAYFGPDASGKLVNTLSGPIGSLRVGYRNGFALYHGNDGHEWSIPLRREAGRWRIDEAEPWKRTGS